jgi:glycosyltransferase involved in cell wall biosynthesis
MKYPKISIVTPSYNQGQYIEQTITSILNQDYPNLEYIIIDGGSTDNTVEIIKKYESKLAYWISEPDKGQSDALNKGLAKCTGDIFNWINSDDYLEVGSLWAIGEAFRQDNPDMVIGKLRIFEDSTNDTILLYHGKPQQRIESEFYDHYLSQPSAFYNMEVIQKLGKRVQTNLHYVMDLELWCRFRFHFPQARIVILDKLVAHFREHTQSKTVSQRSKFQEEINALLLDVLKKKKVPSKYQTLLFESPPKEIKGLFEDTDLSHIKKNTLLYLLFKRRYTQTKDKKYKLYYTYFKILQYFNF